MAALAASLSSGGQGKSGKPCARFTPPEAAHSRLISRMTDSSKLAAFALDQPRRPPGWCAVPLVARGSVMRHLPA